MASKQIRRTISKVKYVDYVVLIKVYQNLV